ncbi:MAG TPA: TonB-dependent receptor [Allosphingosinicella sp.]|nr:TonB-dependent receptor [Allosphingosinicella sp.]
MANSTRLSRAALFSSSTLALLALAASPAHAQEPPADPAAAAPADEREAGTVEEIVVTAQRRSENMQNVPIAITAVSEEQIATTGITGMQQLSTIVPGINIRNASGAAQFYIRGVGTSATVVENPVAVYVDDIYLPTQRAVNLDFIDVAQVSVLKGPQGTLFGRNSTGGVFQIRTREPTERFQLHARTSIDNYGTWRNGLWLGGGIAEGVRASLTGAYTTQAEGWGRNTVAGYDTFKIDEDYALRGRVLVDAGNLRVRLAADYTSRAGNIGQNEVPYPGTYLQFDPVRVGANDTNSDVFDTRYNDGSYQTLEDGGVSMAIDYDTGPVILRSITARRWGQAYYEFDIDRTATNATFTSGTEDYNSTSQEIQIVSNMGDRFTWVLGGFYFRFMDSLDPARVFFKGPAAPLPTSNARQDTFTRQLATSYAAFGQATYRLFDETRLTFGIRYTDETRDFTGVRQLTRNDGTFIPNAVVVDSSVSATNWSFRAALDHRFSQDIMVYAAFNRGFKSGGFNLNDPTNPPYAPEQLDAYSVGFKADLFGRRLRFNADAFYYDYTNLQVVRFDVVSVITNAASAEMYGIDLELQAYATDNLFLTAGLSLLHSEFISYPNAGASIPATVPGNANVLTFADAAGNRVPYAQPVTFNVGINYTHETSWGRLLFAANNSYNGRYYHEADNRLSQSPYNILGASITWTSNDDRFSARLWVTNLLNEYVATQGSSQRNGYLSNYNNPPRLFGLTLEARLGR